MEYIKVDITEEEVDLLQGQQVDLMNLSDIIAYTMSTNCQYEIDPAKVNDLVNTRSKKQYEHTITMNQIASKHCPTEYLDKNYSFNIDFRSHTITYEI